jgi:hypothetical protein
MDEALKKLLKKIDKKFEHLEEKQVYSQDIAPKEVKQQAIDGIIIFRGLIADRPSDGSTEIQAYWAEDEKKLYLWNTLEDEWESSTFA